MRLKELQSSLEGLRVFGVPSLKGLLSTGMLNLNRSAQSIVRTVQAHSLLRLCCVPQADRRPSKDPTTAHLAAQMLFTAESVYNDIDGKSVMDLGCGCGVLSIAARLIGAASVHSSSRYHHRANSIACTISPVIGVDVDNDALRIAADNLADLELREQVDLLQLAILPAALRSSVLDRFAGRIDTVVMNPPFGTKTAGLDMLFLEQACKVGLTLPLFSAGVQGCQQISPTAVYSLHKSSTREHINRRVRTMGYRGDVIAQMRYDLPKTMRFHRQASKDIEVDLWRFVKLGAG